MKRKWKVGDIEDRTMDESVESSLGRIENAFQNKKSWDDVMSKRQDAVVRQRDRIVVSKPCGGFSFSTSHYPPALQKLLLKCGGKRPNLKLHSLVHTTPKGQMETPLSSKGRASGSLKALALVVKR